MSDQRKLLFQEAAHGGLVEVWQKRNTRFLTINSVVQSCLNVEQPAQLASPLYNAFLAALLFIESPKKVLLAGLGGGALANYLHHLMPEIQGEAVEINETVAAVAKRYFDFPETQWDISIKDIRQWSGSDYDLMFLDIAENDLTPAWLISEDMLTHLKRQLSVQGVLIINLLVDNAYSLSSSLMTIRKIFKRKTLCLGVQDHNNIVVFAFNQQPVYCSENELTVHIKKLAEVWPLDFNVLLAQLLKDNPEGSGVF